eukprot:364276-Chlamydomonas_euryale.AAC.1
MQGAGEGEGKECKGQERERAGTTLRVLTARRDDRVVTARRDDRVVTARRDDQVVTARRDDRVVTARRDRDRWAGGRVIGWNGRELRCGRVAVRGVRREDQQCGCGRCSYLRASLLTRLTTWPTLTAETAALLSLNSFLCTAAVTCACVRGAGACVWGGEVVRVRGEHACARGQETASCAPLRGPVMVGTGRGCA